MRNKQTSKVIDCFSILKVIKMVIILSDSKLRKKSLNVLNENLYVSFLFYEFCIFMKNLHFYICRNEWY